MIIPLTQNLRARSAMLKSPHQLNKQVKYIVWWILTNLSNPISP